MRHRTRPAKERKRTVWNLAAQAIVAGFATVACWSYTATSLYLAFSRRGHLHLYAALAIADLIAPAYATGMWVSWKQARRSKK